MLFGKQLLDARFSKIAISMVSIADKTKSLGGFGFLNALKNMYIGTHW